MPRHVALRRRRPRDVPAAGQGRRRQAARRADAHAVLCAALPRAAAPPQLQRAAPRPEARQHLLVVLQARAQARGLRRSEEPREPGRSRGDRGRHSLLHVARAVHGQAVYRRERRVVPRVRALRDGGGWREGVRRGGPAAARAQGGEGRAPASAEPALPAVCPARELDAATRAVGSPDTVAAPGAPVRARALRDAVARRTPRRAFLQAAR